MELPAPRGERGEGDPPEAPSGPTSGSRTRRPRIRPSGILMIPSHTMNNDNINNNNNYNLNNSNNDSYRRGG